MTKSNFYLEETVYWLAPHALLSLLSYRIQKHLPRDDTTHSDLGPPIINH